MYLKPQCHPNESFQLDVVEIVARIAKSPQERERSIVEGNCELIQTAPREEKVKKVIERVWEG